MPHADYIDNQALLTNSPAQVDSLLQSLDQATGDNNLCTNANNVHVLNKKERSSLKVAKF